MNTIKDAIARSISHTKTINGQEFTRIRYTNRGAHAPTETWYPTENLEWLRERCCFELA